MDTVQPTLADLLFFTPDSRGEEVRIDNCTLKAIGALRAASPEPGARIEYQCGCGGRGLGAILSLPDGPRNGLLINSRLPHLFAIHRSTVGHLCDELLALPGDPVRPEEVRFVRDIQPAYASYSSYRRSGPRTA